MCRYAFRDNKPHYAYFKCRKLLKRKNLFDLIDDKAVQSKEAKCPQCKNLMANIGLDFESPKKTAIKALEHLQGLFAVRITYDSCGCGAPDYLPKNAKALKEHFENILEGCIKEHKSCHEYNNDEAFNYWQEKISDISIKLASIKL
jgi:hypothetical protein